ncbi:LD-carboxypeptidase [Blautia sp. HCP3S3_H10_1]|uniref:LD-carboxypeptidase n=1 Tax=unclassified Blautia TaxID=2648079 RepID=UPI003F8D9E32
MKQGSKIGIVCCSNGISKEQTATLDMLVQILDKSGFVPELSPYIYADENGSAGTARQRAQALMKFYEDDSVEEIFDISGGDMANELLPYLDFQTIAWSKKHFWGYSDLTTILNAIYSRTGKTSVLYQIRNLTYEHGQSQITDFLGTTLAGSSALYDFPCNFIRGSHMNGVVVGGNIRCLLKLAGTPYWPDMREKILLLESYGGKLPQMITYLSQLQQMGVFKKVNGILLGTFSQMEKENCQPDMGQLILDFAEKKTPVARTPLIGHGTDSKAIRIGHQLKLYSAEANARIYREE